MGAAIRLALAPSNGAALLLGTQRSSIGAPARRLEKVPKLVYLDRQASSGEFEHDRTAGLAPCGPVFTASFLRAMLWGSEEDREAKRPRTFVGFGGATLPPRPSVREMRQKIHSRGPCQSLSSRLANAEREEPASGRRSRERQRARLFNQPYAVLVTVDRLSLGAARRTPARAARALGTRYRLRAGSTTLLTGRPAIASLVVALLAFASGVLRLAAGYSAAAVQITDGSRSLPTRCARRAALGRNRAAAEPRCSAARVSSALVEGGRR
jgi:hypothetical protein